MSPPLPVPKKKTIEIASVHGSESEDLESKEVYKCPCCYEDVDPLVEDIEWKGNVCLDCRSGPQPGWSAIRSQRHYRWQEEHALEFLVKHTAKVERQRQADELIARDEDAVAADQWAAEVAEAEEALEGHN